MMSPPQLIQMYSLPLLWSLVDRQLSWALPLGDVSFMYGKACEVAIHVWPALQGMCAILSVDATAQQSMLELVLPHVAAFLPAQEGELPPLKLDQCAKLQVSSYACHGMASRGAPETLLHNLMSRTDCSRGDMPWLEALMGSSRCACASPTILHGQYFPSHRLCAGAGR